MAKIKKRIDIQQISLFEVIQESALKNDPTPGSMDIDKAFREAVSLDLKECPLSRYQVAAIMSELTSQDITKSMLDSWTAESKEQHRFPAIFVPAFCQATGGSRTLRMLGVVSKRYVMEGPEALRASIRRLDEEIGAKQADKRIQVLFLKKMEGQ
jgi:hypothetical protein